MSAIPPCLLTILLELASRYQRTGYSSHVTHTQLPPKCHERVTSMEPTVYSVAINPSHFTPLGSIMADRSALLNTPEEILVKIIEYLPPEDQVVASRVGSMRAG